MENLINYSNLCKVHKVCFDCPFELTNIRYKTHMKKCQYGKYRRK